MTWVGLWSGWVGAVGCRECAHMISHGAIGASTYAFAAPAMVNSSKVQIEKTPYITISHNGLRPSQYVKQQHLDALRGSDGREFMNGITWTKPLPDSMKTNAGSERRPSCATRFAQWRVGVAPTHKDEEK